MSTTYTIGATHDTLGTEGQRLHQGSEADAIREARQIADTAGHGWRPYVYDDAGRGVEIPRPERKTRTITLTGRRPVKIAEDEWPIIASAKGDSYSGPDYGRYQQALGQGECDEYAIRVRQHADGRILVYAVLSAAIAAWGQPAHGESQRGGVLLTAEDDIAAAIRAVGDECQIPDAVIRACIADLPAETI